MKGETLDDIDARRISLGQLAGQLSGFIGGSEEVKKAIVNGLHSNVTQLSKLLQTSCGDKGCNCDDKNFRDEVLKNLQNTFEKYDEIEREINSLKKDVAEKSEAPGKAPSVRDPEIQKLQQQNERLKKEISSQSSTLNNQITTVIPLVDNKIKELDSKKKDVDSLQSQVNELNKQIEEGNKNPKSPQKVNENQLKKAEKDLKNAKNNFPEKESKSLDAHQKSMSSLKSLQGLCQHCENVEGNKSKDPKELLNNLCSGLEKFLGYQETSKGYSGDGIVYSDLDRLCDGVMSFLHGVLHNIQPKLGQHMNEISKAIDSLNLHKHSGKEGFNAAIGRVLEGVKQYNEGVKASNKKVSGQINLFTGNINMLQDTSNKILQERNERGEAMTYNADQVQKAVTQVDNKVAECLQHAKDFIDNITQNNEHVNDLSDDLKRNVISARDNIAYQRGELERIHRLQEQDRKALEQGVRERLQDLGKCVNTEIMERVKTLVEEIKKKGSAILDQLREIERKLWEYVQEFEAWIKQARNVIADAEKQVAVIEKEMNDPEPGQKNNKKDIDEAARTIQDNIGTLYEQFEGVKEKYLKTFKILKGEDGTGADKDSVLGKLSELPGEVQAAVPHDFKTLTKHRGEWDLNGKMELFRSQMQQNVGNYLRTLKEAVEAGIDAQNGSVAPGKTPALTSLDGNSELKSRLGYLGGLIESAKLDNQKEGLGYCIEVILYFLKSAKQIDNKGWDKVTQRFGDGLGQAIGTAVTAVDSRLGELLQKAIQAGIKRLQQEINVDVVAKFDSIDNNFTQLDKLANSANKELAENTSTIMNKFGTLCYDIRSAAGEPNGLKGKLKELSELIDHAVISINGKDQKGLHEIKNEFGRLRTSLKDGAITLAEQLLGVEVPKFQKTCVTTLKDHVIQQVETAEQAITQDLRAKYVTFMKDQLTVFAEKCQTELNELPDEITADADKGAKGFMKKIAHFIPQIKGFFETTSEEQKTLKIFAEWLLLRFNDFFEALYPQEDFQKVRRIFDPCRNALHNLLSKLITSQHFDPTFTTNLHTLKTKLNELTPKQFGEESTALLQSLKDGMTALTDVLSKCYINAYEGAEPIDKWTEPLPADLASKSTATPPKEKLTPDGERCAKACLTIVPIIWKTLGELAKHLGKDDSAWRKYKMYASTKSTPSLHKSFFRENGYDVTLSDNADSGELNHKDTFKGNNIYDHLTTGNHVLFKPKSSPSSASSPADPDGPTIEVVDERALIPELNSYHQLFLQVCHHTHLDSPKLPCSIYEMLAWCTGFQFSPVFEKFEQHINSEFMVTDKADPTKKTIQPIEAYPADVTATKTIDALTQMCSDAYPVLTSILGNGHANGIYAVEFSNNSLKLYYPSSMVQLLCMLYEITKRLHQQLHFLYQQCKYGSDQSGWKDCWYGNQIGGSSVQCNSIQCANQACTLSANQGATQSATQIAEQTCNQHPTCGVKSPLQSFLEDGLVGYLPHNVSFRGTNITCSNCPKSSPGQPCKTPMGFPEIAVTASHRKTGKHIYDVLRDFCSRSSKPLSKLCQYLQCLLHRTPQSLDDMWAFYYNFLKEWHGTGRRDEVSLRHKRDAFNNAVNEANFKREYDGLKVNSVFHSTHSSKSTSHGNGDLVSLVCGAASNRRCGPYLQSLNNDIAGIYSKKYAGRYLSWIVYLTETFYQLLHSLYEDCNKTCGGDKARCRIAKCPQPCTVTEKSPTANHESGCSSIIKCNSTSSVFCRYGFIFSDRRTLSGMEHTEQRRTCNDFCSVLKKVLDGESVLVKLFNAIDEFMKEIRWPFMCLLLALWSLSVLYLLHIAVVRLDVLRIRSHLRSPSSHRIAAQSLLAAARVRALASVKYFSP
ncbi:hypothetical protein, conserved [Babesia ovata]|uniref:Extracellular matrix-binding ebh n=1 Tax=Babesia ovata TaxID=189622 RepID=A0A2H6KJG5_9APIC|nr:uncharacterized protein BOVATA_046210 [Babesia ovata]GBE63128.1 hypothetical protein, conserved [Babesia ovata]